MFTYIKYFLLTIPLILDLCQKIKIDYAMFVYNIKIVIIYIMKILILIFILKKLNNKYY